MVPGFIFALCWAFLWVWLANRMALSRSRGTKAWVWAAALVGPFALAVLYFMPVRQV
jgi:hypothetical protein